MKRIFVFSVILCLSLGSQAQPRILGNKIGKLGTGILMKGTGMDKFIEGPQPVTTSFTDVDMKGAQLPSMITPNSVQPLYLLPRNDSGGYILCSGYYELTCKSYCLHAGTYGPSAGDGYMYAPLRGSKEDVIKLILHRAEGKPEISQKDIQVLLWAIVAKTRFSDYEGSVKATAMALLQPKELLMLQGDGMAILSGEAMERIKNRMPLALQLVFEAENNIRSMVANGSYSYSEMEQNAIRAGMAAPRSDVPSGIWTLLPAGYYIRYMPEGYSQTKVQLYVPEELIAGDQRPVYNAIGSVACPANTGSQRLAMTNEPLVPGTKTVLMTDCQ